MAASSSGATQHNSEHNSEIFSDDEDDGHTQNRVVTANIKKTDDLGEKFILFEARGFKATIKKDENGIAFLLSVNLINGIFKIGLDLVGSIEDEGKGIVVIKTVHGSIYHVISRNSALSGEYPKQINYNQYGNEEDDFPWSYVDQTEQFDANAAEKPFGDPYPPSEARIATYPFKYKFVVVRRMSGSSTADALDDFFKQLISEEESEDDSEQSGSSYLDSDYSDSDDDMSSSSSSSSSSSGVSAAGNKQRPFFFAFSAAMEGNKNPVDLDRVKERAQNLTEARHHPPRDDDPIYVLGDTFELDGTYYIIVGGFQTDGVWYYNILSSEDRLLERRENPALLPDPLADPLAFLKKFEFSDGKGLENTSLTPMIKRERQQYNYDMDELFNRGEEPPIISAGSLDVDKWKADQARRATASRTHPAHYLRKKRANDLIAAVRAVREAKTAAARTRAQESLKAMRERNDRFMALQGSRQRAAGEVEINKRAKTWWKKNKDYHKCQICLGGFDDDEVEGDKAVQLRCGHWFHGTCIQGWQKPKTTIMDNYKDEKQEQAIDTLLCPICKTPALDDSFGDGIYRMQPKVKLRF